MKDVGEEKQMRAYPLISFLPVLLLVGSCAGPTNPFGNEGLTLPPKIGHSDLPISIRSVSSVTEDFNVDPVSIHFSPKKMNFHQTRDFKVHIHDPNGVGPLSLIKFYYNKRDLTSQWMNKAKVTKDTHSKNVTIAFSGLKLPASRDHDIIVKYQHGHNHHFSLAKYESPDCSMTSLDPLGELTPFSKGITRQYEPLIEGLSSQEGVNPSMVAGLIAQESAFNPRAVSFAKAIGLTQVTSGASQEIVSNFEHFPVYPEIQEIPVPLIKTLILSGKLNQQNEWRLHPRYSILGGIHYLKRLEDYWFRGETQKIIHTVFPGRGDEVLDDIILASYNSGPFRVKKSLKARGKDWLNAHDLTEAKKYVKKVKSYCYHFAANHQ